MFNVKFAPHDAWSWMHNTVDTVNKCVAAEIVPCLRNSSSCPLWRRLHPRSSWQCVSIPQSETFSTSVHITPNQTRLEHFQHRLARFIWDRRSNPVIAGYVGPPSQICVGQLLFKEKHSDLSGGNAFKSVLHHRLISSIPVVILHRVWIQTEAWPIFFQAHMSSV